MVGLWGSVFFDASKFGGFCGFHTGSSHSPCFFVFKSSFCLPLLSFSLPLLPSPLPLSFLPFLPFLLSLISSSIFLLPVLLRTLTCSTSSWMRYFSGDLALWKTFSFVYNDSSSYLCGCAMRTTPSGAGKTWDSPCTQMWSRPHGRHCRAGFAGSLLGRRLACPPAKVTAGSIRFWSVTVEGPVCSILSCDRVSQTFGPFMPSWSCSLAKSPRVQCPMSCCHTPSLSTCLLCQERPVINESSGATMWIPWQTPRKKLRPCSRSGCLPSPWHGSLDHADPHGGMLRTPSTDACSSVAPIPTCADASMWLPGRCRASLVQRCSGVLLPLLRRCRASNLSTSACLL